MAGRFSMDRGMALRSWPGRGCGLGPARFGGRPVRAGDRRPLVPAADRCAARPGHAAAVLASCRGPPDQAGRPVNDRFSEVADDVLARPGIRGCRSPEPRTPTARRGCARTRSRRPDRPAGPGTQAADPALAARSPADIPQAADPVDVATGDVLLFQDDVSLPGVLPLVIEPGLPVLVAGGTVVRVVVGVQPRSAAADRPGPDRRRVRGRACSVLVVPYRPRTGRCR